MKLRHEIGEMMEEDDDALFHALSKPIIPPDLNDRNDRDDLDYEDLDCDEYEEYGDDPM